jgi:hypothetical protein
MLAILLNLGAVLMVIGIAMVVYQTGKRWPQSKRRAEKPDPSDGPKPSIPYSGVLVTGAGALLVALASLLGP